MNPEPGSITGAADPNPGITAMTIRGIRRSRESIFCMKTPLRSSRQEKLVSTGTPPGLSDGMIDMVTGQDPVRGRRL